MSENKNKGWKVVFFVVGHIFYMSEDSLTVKYTESGLILDIKFLHTHKSNNEIAIASLVWFREDNF